MKIASLITRILLGAMFVVFGLNGILRFIPVPPGMPAMVTAFNGVMFASHYMAFVGAVQLLAGLALLANRYVPLALVALAAVLANILAFHVTMMPATILPALVATALWFLVAWPLRATFAPLLAARPEPAPDRV